MVSVPTQTAWLGLGPSLLKPSPSPQPHRQSSEHVTEAAEENWFFGLHYGEDLSAQGVGKQSCHSLFLLLQNSRCQGVRRMQESWSWDYSPYHYTQSPGNARQIASPGKAWEIASTISPPKILCGKTPVVWETKHPSDTPSPFPSDILSHSPQMGPSSAKPLSSTSFLFWAAKSLPDVVLEGEGREKALSCG